MTIIPIDVSERLKQQKKERDVHKYELGMSIVNADEDNYVVSTNASKDSYMHEALNKVRQSDISFNHDYTNMNGSGLFNPKTKPVKQMKPISVSGSRLKPVKTNKPKKRKEVVIDETKLVPYDWDQMCKQLGKPRLREEVSYFGSLRASLQTKRKGRFTYEY